MVVNVASVGGLVPMPLHSLYAASKHALVGLGESLAFETRDEGVRVVTVCPGPVETEFLAAADGTKALAREMERFRFSFDRADTIARGILRAALRRRSGVVLPSFKSALPRWTYRLLGPIARGVMASFVRRLRPLLLEGSGSTTEAAA